MDIHILVAYAKAHWFDALLLPGNILAIDAIVKSEAEKRGFKVLASWCDRIANICSFIVGVISGIINRNKGDQNAQSQTSTGTGPGDITKPGSSTAK